MAIFNFNSADFEPMSFSPIPDGWYTSMVTESEIKETQNGGLMLMLTFTIVDPLYSSRKIFNNYNIKNSNEKAVAIAMGSLSALCKAINVPQFSDTQQLHGIPLLIRVKTRPATRGADGREYDAQNVVSDVRACADGFPTGAVTPGISAVGAQFNIQPQKQVQTSAQPQSVAPQQPWSQPSISEQVKHTTDTTDTATPDWMNGTPQTNDSKADAEIGTESEKEAVQSAQQKSAPWA